MIASVRIVTAVLLLAMLLTAIAAACPLCKEAKSDSEYPGGGASLGRGFYYSILLMISVPFLVVATIGFRIWRNRRIVRFQRRAIPPLRYPLRGPGP
jgi:hypothetical protein